MPLEAHRRRGRDLRVHRPRQGHPDVHQSHQRKNRSGVRLPAAARSRGGRHDDGHCRATDRGRHPTPRGSSPDLRTSPAGRPNGSLARAGAAQHLYAVGRQHRPRPGSEHRDLVRGRAPLRRGQLRVPVPDGRRAAIQPRRTDRRPAAQPTGIAGQSLAADTRHDARPRCLANQSAGAQARSPQRTRHHLARQIGRRRAGPGSQRGEPPGDDSAGRRPPGVDRARPGRLAAQQGFCLALRRDR